MSAAENRRRHHLHNRNSYPLDPTTNKTPLKHLKSWRWSTHYCDIASAQEFDKLYKFHKKVFETKLVIIKSIKFGGYQLVKVYDTDGDINKFIKCYKEFKFVRETELVEYVGIYFNHKTQQVYIRQPIYSKSLAMQIYANKNAYNDEKAVKRIAFDILNKIWIIHNTGNVHGDIGPQNVVKREFNDNDIFVHDGWKLIGFANIKKYKSKGKYIGTPGFSAPEMDIGSDKNKYLYKSDIFSLGLLILFALFGKQPLDISDEEKTKYGQYDDLFDRDDKENKYESVMEREEKEFKNDLKRKMMKNWYYEKLLKSENMVKNYLIQIYFDGKISLDLFELLYGGMLVFNPQKRFDSEKVHSSKWFADIIGNKHNES